MPSLLSFLQLLSFLLGSFSVLKLVVIGVITGPNCPPAQFSKLSSQCLKLSLHSTPVLTVPKPTLAFIELRQPWPVTTLTILPSLPEPE